MRLRRSHSASLAPTERLSFARRLGCAGVTSVLVALRHVGCPRPAAYRRRGEIDVVRAGVGGSKVIGIRILLRSDISVQLCDVLLRSCLQLGSSRDERRRRRRRINVIQQHLSRRPYLRRKGDALLPTATYEAKIAVDRPHIAVDPRLVAEHSGVPAWARFGRGHGSRVLRMSSADKNRNSEHRDDCGSECCHDQPGAPAIKRAGAPTCRILRHSSHDSIFQPGRHRNLLIH